MTRLIDAERIVTMELFDEEHEEYCKKKISIEDMIATYTTEMELPTVDAEPVRHAYWIRHEDWEEEGCCGWKCSECGMGSEVDYKYCMRCGAKMDAERKEE